jgi:hypothetical protein
LARPIRTRRITIVQAVSLIVALVLGVMIFTAKVSAQTSTKDSAPAAKGDAKPPVKEAPADKDAKKDVKKAPEKAEPAKEEAKDADAGSPLDYAVVQTEEDFPADLSDEEKNAIGTGKVPIHREGKFRSPFAHPRFGGPAHVKVGLVINNVREYNIQTGSFDADFFLSLMSDKPMGTVEPFFTNGHDVNQTVLADTPTFKSYRYTGTFLSPVDLRKYPFDTQNLTIEFEDLRGGVDQIELEAYQERTSLDEGFTLAGWGVASIGAHTYKHLYAPRFDRDDLYVSRYKFSLGIDRFATSAAFSVFVPAYIIVLISLMGLWVPPDELEVRSNAGAPMLAAAVFFHYSLTQSLPATAYLTRADKLMLGVYVALLLNMVSTWVFLIVEEDNLTHAFRWARTWVPLATFVLMLAVTVL